MERKGKATARRDVPAGRKKAAAGRGRSGDGPAPDDLSVRAAAGDEEAFLALVRFHSTFNPMPLSAELLLRSSIEDGTRRRLLGRLKRKEDALLRPFPAIDMVFWGEEWVQKALDRFMWRKRGNRPVPNEEFLGKLWDASREGAMLQLRIYKRMNVTPSAWVRVKGPHFANLGLSETQMLKIARAEGCRFEEEAFLRAVNRFRRGAG